MHFSKPPLGTPLDWENPLNDETVMALAMNEGHGDKVQDLSLSGNHGTLNNFAFPSTVDSGWNPGQTGVGLNFDGVNGNINCGNSSLNFDAGTLDFTVSTRIKADSFAGNTAIFDNRDANDDGWRFTFIDGVLYFSIDAIDITSGTTFSDTTKWYNLVGVINRSGNGQLYVNGVADGAAVAIGGEVMDISGDLRIGSSSNGSANFFNGFIDQPRIQCRAWSAKEVMDYAINPWQVYLDE